MKSTTMKLNMYRVNKLIYFSIFSFFFINFCHSQDFIFSEECGSLSIEYHEYRQGNYSLLEKQISNNVWIKVIDIGFVSKKTKKLDIEEPGTYRVTSIKGNNKNYLSLSKYSKPDYSANTSISNEVNFVTNKNDVCSLSSSKNNMFKIYPNPTSQYINIQTADEIRESDLIEIILYDVSGSYLGKWNRLNNIDISGYQSGLYVVPPFHRTIS